MSTTSDRDSDAVGSKANTMRRLKCGFDPSSVVKARGSEAPASMTTLVPGSELRRCYGAAVEAALAEALFAQSNPLSAPRLRELMSQLDADGHNTVAMRTELDELVASGSTNDLKHR